LIACNHFDSVNHPARNQSVDYILFDRENCGSVSARKHLAFSAAARAVRGENSSGNGDRLTPHSLDF